MQFLIHVLSSLTLASAVAISVKRQGVGSTVDTVEGLVEDVTLLPETSTTIASDNLKRQGVGNTVDTVEVLVEGLALLPGTLETVLDDNA